MIILYDLKINFNFYNENFVCKLNAHYSSCKEADESAKVVAIQ